MLREKTIALNGSMLDDHPTGVGVYSFNVINQLTDLYCKDNSSALTVFTPTVSYLNDKLKIVKLSALLLSSKHGKLAAICRIIWNTFFYPLQARQYDVQISTTTHGSFLLKNQVLTIHDLLSLRYDNISWHQRLYFKHLLPLLVAKSKLIITVSEASKLDIIRFLKCPPEKVHAIYNGYDDERYYRTQAKSDHIQLKYGVQHYLLAIGPTYPHKNFESLIDAYNQLPAVLQQDHPLVIAGGKNPYLQRLKQYVHHTKAAQHIQFIGYVPIDLMPSLYREATALVFPSLYEGFGIPLLEAMACGCPVLCSNTSSMPEVCADAALYFDPHDTTAIKDTITTLLLNQDDTRETLVKKGFVRVQQFSWKKTAQHIKTLIDHEFQPN
jgi:glycosyltransferase involved in cell wall biosynthesis